MQLSDLMKSMQATFEKLTPAKAQQLAKALAGGEGREQVSKVAHELLDWSQKNRERLVDVVQREVRSQMKTLGVATKDEVDALRKRVRELERATGTKPVPRKRTSAKRSTAKKPTATRSTSGGSSPARTQSEA